MAAKDLKPVLVDDWHRAWRYASVQFNALGLLVMGAAEILGQSWSGLPPEIQQRVPHATTIAMTLFALSLVGRLLKKAHREDCEPANDGEQHGSH